MAAVTKRGSTFSRCSAGSRIAVTTRAATAQMASGTMNNPPA